MELPCTVSGCGACFSSQGLFGLHLRLKHGTIVSDTKLMVSTVEETATIPDCRPFYLETVGMVAEMVCGQYDETISSIECQQLRARFEVTYENLREIDQHFNTGVTDPLRVEPLMQGCKRRSTLNQVINDLGLARASRLTESIEKSDNEMVGHLYHLVSEDGKSSFIQKLSHEQAQSLIDAVYEILRTRTTSESGRTIQSILGRGPILDDAEIYSLLRWISRLAEQMKVLPSGLVIKGVVLTNKVPFDVGSFGDVFMGDLNGQKVAIKQIRVYLKDTQEMRDRHRKYLCREVLVWSLLDHQNILPFYGIGNDLFDVPDPSVGQTVTDFTTLISPFMGNKNLSEYLRTQDGAAPDALTWKLLTEILAGILYLHTNQIVHGDLRPPNILIDDGVHVRLSDFGVANFADLTPHSASSVEVGAHSPERYFFEELGLERYFPTKEADVFAVGTVCLEVG
ncbi:hypothetical protein NLI96_g11922 [Meripilus lineatus]|uniref:Protein kinase domain-containing protein n=1 Tax=Meripilus lineatus TaxID=2056292 RepID=A0AAD5UR23_9APHY|nr:hypothetical protein NLI96_g11922 [Physisporinus lineatus]